MLYLIDNKHYIKTAPMIYTEVKLSLKNDKVVIIPTDKKLEANGKTIIKSIDFQKEKDTIKNELQSREKTRDTNITYIKRNKR